MSRAPMSLLLFMSSFLHLVTPLTCTCCHPGHRTSPASSCRASLRRARSACQRVLGSPQASSPMAPTGTRRSRRHRPSRASTCMECRQTRRQGQEEVWQREKHNSDIARWPPLGAYTRGSDSSSRRQSGHSAPEHVRSIALLGRTPWRCLLLVACGAPELAARASQPEASNRVGCTRSFRMLCCASSRSRQTRPQQVHLVCDLFGYVALVDHCSGTTPTKTEAERE